MLLGVGEVNAKTRAAETGSAMVLNSPTGVKFPGTDTAPPMTRTDLARRNTCGEWEAASARFVKGPIAIMSIVSGGFSSRIRSISRYEGWSEALKREFDATGLVMAASISLEVNTGSGGGRSNKVRHVSSGLVW